MKIRNIALVGLLGGFIFSGCAINMPVSEGLVFSGREHPKGESDESFIKRGESILSFSYTFPTSNVVQTIKDERNIAQNYILDRRFRYSFPGSGISWIIGDRVSIGIPFDIFSGIGVDATVRTVYDLFLTLKSSYGFLGQEHAEIILQKPFYYFRDEGGLSIGLFYRNQALHFAPEGNTALSIYETTGTFVQVPWYGGRIMIQSFESGSGNKKVPLRGFFSSGYSPEFNAMLFSFGLGINIK